MMQSDATCFTITIFASRFLTCIVFAYAHASRHFAKCADRTASFLATPLQDTQEEKAPKESEKSEKSRPNFSGDWVLLRVEGWESLIRFPLKFPKKR